VSQLLPEPDGRPISEQEIREALDAMVANNGGHPVSLEETRRKPPIKAKKPFT
jgi:hypothetical protein